MSSVQRVVQYRRDRMVVAPSGEFSSFPFLWRSPARTVKKLPDPRWKMRERVRHGEMMTISATKGFFDCAGSSKCTCLLRAYSLCFFQTLDQNNQSLWFDRYRWRTVPTNRLPRVCQPIHSRDNKSPQIYCKMRQWNTWVALFILSQIDCDWFY